MLRFPKRREKMRKRYGWFLLLVFVWSILLSGTAFADIGPKPSVVVDFTGLEGRTFYATLLSEKASTGPWSEGGEYIDWMGDPKAFDAFAAYEDSGGFHFLSWMQDCTENHRLEWTYYPPQRFKVLLYFPQEGELLAGGEIYERYAFDSYFTIDVADGIFYGRESYDFRWETISLLCRILLTIAIELAVAWVAFGFREKRQIRLICLTNLFTQTALHILLNIADYRGGAMFGMFCYILLEILIFAVEGAIYARYLRDAEKKMHPYRYAFAANLSSFCVGLLLAEWIPGIF